MVPSFPFKGDFKVYSLLYQAQEKVPMRRPRLPATKNLQSEFASNMLIRSQAPFILLLTELLILYYIFIGCKISVPPSIFLTCS